MTQIVKEKEIVIERVVGNTKYMLKIVASASEQRIKQISKDQFWPVGQGVHKTITVDFVYKDFPDLFNVDAIVSVSHIDEYGGRLQFGMRLPLNVEMLAVIADADESSVADAIDRFVTYLRKYISYLIDIYL